MAHTLKELSDMYAKKQPHQVDSLTEESPILAMMPWEEASHGLWNAYEDVSDVTGGSFVDMDDELPTVGVESNLKKIDLSIMGGKMFCGQDKAKMWGGKEAYFASKLPAVLKQSGMNAEYDILYNTFRQYCIDNSLTYEPSGATGDNNYTILAVRFASGETTGLYSPEGFSQGAMLTAEPLYGGQLHEKEINSKMISGYSVQLKGYFGVMVANPKTVHAFVNIKSTKLPTAAQIDDMLADIRATPPNTYMFMHKKCQNLLGTIKNGLLEMRPSDTNYSGMLATWEGVRIITSYNFLDGTETDVAI